MSKAWAKGSSPAWKRIRNIILQRDKYRCMVRGMRCITVATSVDHIVPKSEGGSDDPSNLRASCKPCNDSRGAAPMDPEPLGRW